MSGDQDDRNRSQQQHAHEDADVGTVAEEAARLLGALSGWAKDSTQGLDAHLATGAAECTYCPICRTVHAVRELSPEVRDQLATAATSALQALTALLATAASGHPDPRGGVEHIDLDDSFDDNDAGPDDWPDPDEPEEGER